MHPITTTHLISTVGGIKTSDALNQIKPITVGYKGVDVPDEYLIDVVWRRGNPPQVVHIVALLQDKASVRVGGRWEPIMGGFGTGAVIQWAFGKTLVMPWMTRRLWRGTQPLELSLTMRFEADNDTESEVVSPCLCLQQIVLPGVYKVSDLPKGVVGREAKNVLKKFGSYRDDDTLVLMAPGPAPIPGMVGDDVTIHVGQFMTFERVIIKDVDIEFDSRFVMGGGPIGATAKVSFETFEVMDKRRMEEVYHPKAKRNVFDKGMVGAAKSAFKASKKDLFKPGVDVWKAFNR